MSWYGPGGRVRGLQHGRYRRDVREDDVLAELQARALQPDLDGRLRLVISERELAAHFNVARGTMHRRLLALEARGLIRRDGEALAPGGQDAGYHFTIL